MRVLLAAVLLGGCALGADPTPREGAPDASARDAATAPQIDASFLRDAGGEASDAELPPLPDAGPAPVDAGLPPPAPDAGTDAGLCVTETCDGSDEDCDGRIDEDAACPCPVVERGGHAYLVCDTNRSWAGARASCETLGYSLVVIEDTAEDAFVYGQLATRGFSDTWIGINDLVTEDRFVWLTSTPVGYTHWDSGEPNDGGSRGEDCGVIMTVSGRESEWDDRDCGDERPYVCEAPAP
ncbi:MAG: C-type lectin domain-containing protein [Sandaracinaceae bacterium]|nr:C-type lectin domain-containing protein [Sandaracinaceae bacterium]